MSKENFEEDVSDVANSWRYLTNDCSIASVTFNSVDIQSVNICEDNVCILHRVWIQVLVCLMTLYGY
jgi:hypothetical protein